MTAGVEIDEPGWQEAIAARAQAAGLADEGRIWPADLAGGEPEVQSPRG